MKIKMKLQAIGWTALTLLTLSIALYLLFYGLHDIELRNEKLSVLNSGECTTGTITSKEVNIYENTDSVEIKYTFTLSSGNEVVGEYYIFYASADRVSDLHTGDKILVAYDERNTDMNLPVKIGEYDTINVEETEILADWFLVVILNPLILGFMTLLLVIKTVKVWRIVKKRDSPLPEGIQTTLWSSK